MYSCEDTTLQVCGARSNMHGADDVLAVFSVLCVADNNETTIFFGSAHPDGQNV